MNSRHLTSLSWITILFIVVVSCAKISSPSGGARDVTPPKVLSTSPENGSANFTGQQFSILFDEYVTLENVNEKLMVSPPLRKRPTITTKGKSVIVKFEDQLSENTTYSFYFQDAIRDLNESNPINNFSYVFSTGDVVDSLSVTGNVYSALTLDPPEEVLVMLYRNLHDTSFKRSLPDYISRTDENGSFVINHLREGEYRLFALKDADNSKNFNLAEEEIAFLDSTIKVTPSTNYLVKAIDTTSIEGTIGEAVASDTNIVEGMYELHLFLPPKTSYYLNSSSRPSKYKLVYSLSLPPLDNRFEFAIAETDDSGYFVEMNEERDTMQVWLTDSILYNSAMLKSIVTFPFTDSLNNVVDKTDSITMRYVAPRAVNTKSRSAKTPTNEFTVTIKNSSLDPSQRPMFTAATPLVAPDSSKMRLFENADTLRQPLPLTFSKVPNNSQALVLESSLTEGKSYTLVALQSAFSDIYGHHNDSTSYSIQVRASDTYATLSFNLTGYEGNCILQLLNASKVVREMPVVPGKMVTLNYLEKGKYTARVIYDLNGDNKWTTGDYDAHRQPEPTSFLPMEIDLLPNFENVVDWDISRINYKKDRESKTSGSAR